MRIYSNISNLQAQRYLGRTVSAISRSLERLSSGKRVNSARDGAADLSRATGLSAQTRGLAQAIRNLNDAQSILSVAESAMQTQLEIVQRMREIALHSANGIASDSDRELLDLELQELYSEFDRISRQTSMNGMSLLDGSFGTLSIQAGVREEDSFDVALEGTKADDVFTKTAGSGVFNTGTTVSTPVISRDVQSADFNNDGKLDIVYNANFSDSITVRLGNGDGTFTSPTQTMSGMTQVSGDLITIGDLNDDGKQDLVISTNNSSSLYIKLGNGNGTFSSANTITTAGVTFTSVLGDVNGDGKQDIVVSNGPGNSISVLIGNSDGTFSFGTTLSYGAQVNNVGLADFNQDGKMDLVFNFLASVSPLGVQLGNGDGTFGSVSTYTGGGIGAPSDIKIADYNHDDKLDVAVLNFNTNNISVLLGNGAGGFTSSATLSVSALTYDIEIADLNDDGNTDIVGTKGDIYLGNGDGSFSRGATVTSDAGTWGLTIGDFTGDSILDIAFGSSTAVLLRLGISTTLSATPAMVSVETERKARFLLDFLDGAINNLIGSRAQLGAYQSRIDSAISFAALSRENLESARSSLEDIDIAAETTELARLQILQQAQVAVLGQANLSMQMVMKLLN